MWKRNVLIATCTLGTLGLSGCGSTAKPPSAGGTTTSVTTPTPTTSGTKLFATGAVPAVSGASDLSKEPVVAAGSSPAPTVLTGRDLVVGTGATAVSTDPVQVQYVGAFYSSGKVFDASWTDSGPTSFPLSGVIPGFKDAIIGMKVGGRREMVIPPAYGYGAAGQPPTIPGNSTLVFVIDLLGIS
jgi:FKBP-type peptidyl-prolyl cis-trans isomerase